MNQDAEAIEALHRDFLDRWNHGDARGLAAQFAADGVRVGARGDIQRGRAEIERAFEELFRGTLRGASVSFGSASVRPLAPELALWQAAITITPAAGAPIPGHVVDVMRKSANRWEVLESHPKLFPPPAPK